MKIRKNDTVMVIAGRDKGKTGKVRFAYPKDERVMVDGINMIKRHTRATRGVKQAGIIEREAPIQVLNLMLLCSRCNHTTRVGSRLLSDGKKVRVCRACGEVMD